MTKFFFLYILSLLAGKFEKICTAFPLGTFLTKKLTGHSLKIFDRKKFLEYPQQIQTRQKNMRHFVRQNQQILVKCKAAFTRQTQIGGCEQHDNMWHTVGKNRDKFYLLPTVCKQFVVSFTYTNLSLPTRHNVTLTCKGRIMFPNEQIN